MVLIPKFFFQGYLLYTAQVPGIHRAQMPLPLLAVITFQVCHSKELLSGCINQDVQTKPHLLSHLSVTNSSLLRSSQAPDVVAYLTATSFLLEATVILNPLTGVHIGLSRAYWCRHYSENLSTAGAHCATFPYKDWTAAYSS